MFTSSRPCPRPRPRSAAEAGLVRLRVVERLPGASSADTPLSGTNRAVGPVARPASRPTLRPSSAISSGVVRISVTVGLWT